ncbi:MAG TPA: Ig-like domain-containing protein [Candidatus Caccocola faecipullorum]|nr:Ig-like domain-containing protein [Candidatus Caccocola faecipullorum]
MKETKKSASGAFSSSAAARGKFGKICLVLLLLATAVFCGFAPQAQALTPNAEGVYELRTAPELKDFRDGINNKTINSTANAKLMSDIDLGGEPWTPIGTGPSNPYKGTFDGGGFTVSGVNVNNGVENPGFGVCAGFFGFIYGNVKNLNVSGEISAESSGAIPIYIGGIVGSAQSGANITNCSFSGSVNANSTERDVCAGGVVGHTMGVARGAKIVGCTYTGGSVTAVCGGQGANNRVGGIVGQADSGSTVDNCTASSEKISASGESALNMAGGIAGRLYYAKMTNCTAASAAISAEGKNSNDAGGITGSAHHGQMSGCAYTGGAGSITATGGEYNNTGRISGNLEIGSSVSNCAWSAWNGDSSENATGMGLYCVDEETTKALPAEEFESGEIILSVIPSCSVVNLTPGGSSTLNFTAQPGGKPLTQEQAAKYIAVQETEYSTFSIDTSAWPYVVTGTDAIGTEDLVFSLYSTNLVTGKPADAPTGNVTITVANAETPAVPVAEIKITPAELSMLVGGTQQLAAAVIPANATNNNVVTWGGGDAAVATVDENGLVTAHGIGTTTITATAGGVSASCSVTADVIHVESVSLDQTELQLTVGEKATLSAAITPENAADKNVTWSSDDAAVATVDENGLVTAHGIGTTTITATTADGGKTATCAVTVSASPQPAPPSGGGSGGGGGCSAGFGALALLAVVPLFARRKK